MPQGDILGGEEVSGIKPAEFAEDLRLDQETGPVEGIGPEKPLFHRPGRGAGLIDQVQIVPGIAPRAPRAAPAGLDASVRETDAGRERRGIVRQPSEIRDQAVDHRRVHQRVVVDDEAEFPACLRQGQVVVLAESADLVAGHPAHPGEVGLRLGEVLRTEAGGHHEALIGHARVRPHPFQTGVQVVQAVHANDDDADERSFHHRKYTEKLE